MWPNSAGGYPGAPPWSLNPAAYQNVPYEQVDWASLAQQWIKMKETIPSMNQGPSPPFPVSHIPPAPPAPSLSVPAKTVPPKIQVHYHKHEMTDDEGGEAPMDMDTKDDEPAQAFPDGANWDQWNQWQTSSQWGWGWPGNAGTVAMAPDVHSGATALDCKVKLQNTTDSLSPTPVVTINNSSSFVASGTIAPNFTAVAAASSFSFTNDGSMFPPAAAQAYWNDNTYTRNTTKANSEGTWHKSSSKHGKVSNSKPVVSTDLPILDAAKRKQLPAWIREGLNKMEREKQRKMDKERMDQEIQSTELNNIDTGQSHNVPVLDYPVLQHVDNVANLNEVDYPKKRKSRFDVINNENQEEDLDTHSKSYKTKEAASQPQIRKTKEQLRNELMLRVRRMLTQLLMETTAYQVQSIAKEELMKVKTTVPATAIRKTSALSSLAGGLGLGIYDSESDSGGSDNELDSDEEIKRAIEQKKRQFQKVEEEIRKEIEEEEANERKDDDDEEQDDDQSEDEENEQGDSSTEGVGHSNQIQQEYHERLTNSHEHTNSFAEKDEHDKNSNDYYHKTFTSNNDSITNRENSNLIMKNQENNNENKSKEILEAKHKLEKNSRAQSSNHKSMTKTCDKSGSSSPSQSQSSDDTRILVSSTSSSDSKSSSPSSSSSSSSRSSSDSSSESGGSSSSSYSSKRKSKKRKRVPQKRHHRSPIRKESKYDRGKRKRSPSGDRKKKHSSSYSHSVSYRESPDHYKYKHRRKSRSKSPRIYRRNRSRSSSYYESFYSSDITKNARKPGKYRGYSPERKRSNYSPPSRRKSSHEKKSSRHKR